ncbi:MAG: L,D-transpeptidase family protein [Haloechinothrix sp.]
MTTRQDHGHDACQTSRPRRLRYLVTAVVAGVLAVALVVGVVMWLGGAESRSEGPSSAPAREPAQEIALAGLTESSTYTTIEGAPADTEPQQNTSGAIVHPRNTVAVHAEPDGKPIAKMERTQLGDTWLPVIDKRDGWVKVLLPSKPNGSTGWIRGENLDHAVTPYEIRVHLTSMRLQLFFEDREVGSWLIGIGKPSTPTPTGRTFLLGSFVDPDQGYSPIILPLGAHSPTLDTFGGGPGTVALHTWPTDEVYGAATSNGCIRVPPDALDRLTEVPLGTLVLIDDK